MIKKRLSINTNKRELIIGFVLIVLGISAPVFINVNNLKIYQVLIESINKDQQGLLLIAAYRLVILNSLRGLPHYLGTFIIAETTEFKVNNVSLPHLKGLLALIIIPAVYSTINVIHGIKYDLGVPALIVIFTIMYLQKADYSQVGLFKKSMIIVLFLLGAQWLDVIPQLSPLGIGRGETSIDIKAVAQILEGSDTLTMFAGLFFILFSFSAIFFTKLIRDEHKLKVSTETNKSVERQLNEARIKALEARNYMELKHLVHDLKTPLTSVQALVSVIRLMEENDVIQEYLFRIEGSIDNLSGMISEILYEDKRNIISTEALLNNILSQISHLHFSSNIKVENRAKDAYIRVNKIRFSRAIINALDNSYNALHDIYDEIFIIIEDIGEKLSFEIMDKGIGIKAEVLEEVLKKGFSMRESTGLGLGFIEDTVNYHDGEMYMSSEPGIGTSLKIIIPKVNRDDEKNSNNR